MGRNKHKKNSSVDHWQSFPPRPMPHQQTYGYPPQYPYPQNGYYAPPVPQFIPEIWYPPQGYGPPYYANMQMHPSRGYRGQINAPYPPNVQFPRSSYGTQKRNNFQHCPSSKVNWKQNAKLAKESAIKPNIKNNCYDNQQIKSNRKGNYDQSQMTYNSHNKNSKKGQYNPMALLINFIKGLKSKLDSIPDQLRKTIIDDFVKNAPIIRSESCTHEVNQDGQCLYCMFGYDETSRLMQMLQYLQNILQTNNKENKNKAKSQKTTEVKNKNKPVKSASLPVQNLVENKKPLVTQTSNAKANEKENENAGEIISEPSENALQNETVNEHEAKNEIVNAHSNKIHDSLDLSKLGNGNSNKLMVNELNKYPDPSDKNNNKIKQDYLKKGQGLLGYQSNKVKEVVKNSKKSNKNKVNINENKIGQVKTSNKIVHEKVKHNKNVKKLNELNTVVQVEVTKNNIGDVIDPNQTEKELMESFNEIGSNPGFDFCGTVKFLRKVCKYDWSLNQDSITLEVESVPPGFEVDKKWNDVCAGDSMLTALHYANGRYEINSQDIKRWREMIIDELRTKYQYRGHVKCENYWEALKKNGTCPPVCWAQPFASLAKGNVYMYRKEGPPIIFESGNSFARKVYIWNISNVYFKPLKLITSDEEKIRKMTKGTVYKIDNVKIEGEKLLVKDEKTGEWK